MPRNLSGFGLTNRSLLPQLCKESHSPTKLNFAHWERASERLMASHVAP